MKSTVHILATVRKPELLDAALLVFATLRVGFPEATVKVWGNGLKPFHQELLRQAATSVSVEFRNLEPTAHDAWIEALIQESLDPFWICDTDVVFWGPMARAGLEKGSDLVMAGRWEPEFDEEWTGTRHMERLHTAVMWLNPSALRSGMWEWMARIPKPWRNSAQFALVRQQFVPLLNGPTLFYDTLAGMYHALKPQGGCVAFEEEQDGAFDHLHCATYADQVKLNGVDLQAAHSAIYQDPSRARGMRVKQNEYYQKRRPTRALMPGGQQGKEHDAI